jgi:hypothetical protein
VRGGESRDGEIRVSAAISGANATAIKAGAAHWPTQPAKVPHWATVPQSGMAWSQPRGIEVLVAIMGEPVHALADAIPASGAKAEAAARSRTSNVRRRYIKNPKKCTRLTSAFYNLGSS